MIYAYDLEYTEPRSEGTSLDIGCGFTGNQAPVYADISLDLNMDKVDPGFLRRIKENNSHPLCASATHLPIRSESMDKIYWNAVLEHLPKETTIKSLYDGHRVLKPRGEAKIILPIITSHLRHYLTIIWSQFPFSLLLIIVALRKAHKFWHIPGVPHLTDVKPDHLSQIFSKIETRKVFYRNTWFHYPWGKIARKLVGGRFIPDIQGQYFIRCIK